MDQTGSVSMAMAFFAGLLSFASPCVLPIVPSFLGFISGMTLDQMTEQKSSSHSVMLFTAWFVLGFSLVFVALGASATAVGGLLLAHQKLFRIIGGLFILVLGLQFMGLFQIGFLQAERRLHLQSKPMGVLGSFLVGITFALGWTPCIGPILGSILMLAASQSGVAQGIGMLSAYSLGFALPFLAAAAALSKFLAAYRQHARHLPKVVFASGVFLVGIALLLITNRFAMLAELLTGWFGA
jgi:cytochrome c-type biogenesis protein